MATDFSARVSAPGAELTIDGAEDRRGTDFCQHSSAENLSAALISPYVFFGVTRRIRFSASRRLRRRVRRSRLGVRGPVEGAARTRRSQAAWPGFPAESSRGEPSQWDAQRGRSGLKRGRRRPVRGGDELGAKATIRRGQASQGRGGAAQAAAPPGFGTKPPHGIAIPEPGSRSRAHERQGRAPAARSRGSAPEGEVWRGGLPRDGARRSEGFATACRTEAEPTPCGAGSGRLWAKRSHVHVQGINA